MFIKRWLFKPKLPEIANKVELCENIRFNINKLNTVYSGSTLIYLDSFCKNITEYTTLINYLINGLNDNASLYDYRIPKHSDRILIRNFFIVNDAYVEIDKVTIFFLTASEKFILLYDNLNSSKEDFTVARNLSICQHIYSNVKTILEKLVKITGS